MKILIVSGFLGAGKTTFIRTLAEKTGKEFVILENEYGEAAIDGELLREQQTIGSLNVWELTEGCICCSRKGDLAASVLTIANTLDPEYLIVEPTGVGKLSHIAAALQQIEYERITLLAPAAVVDGRNWRVQFREYPELYRDQVCNAGTVFVSKMEHADEEDKNRLKKSLEELHPDGKIRVEHYSAMEREEWMHLLNQRFDGTCVEESAGPEVLPDTFSMKGVRMKAPESLLMFLENLIRGEFGEVIRAKGCVRAGDVSLRFDAVNGQYSITGAEDAAEGKAVFIGNGIRRQKIRRYFMEKKGKIRMGQPGSLPRKPLLHLGQTRNGFAKDLQRMDNVELNSEVICDIVERIMEKPYEGNYLK